MSVIAARKMLVKMTPVRHHLATCSISRSSQNLLALVNFVTMIIFKNEGDLKLYNS